MVASGTRCADGWTDGAQVAVIGALDRVQRLGGDVIVAAGAEPDDDDAQVARRRLIVSPAGRLAGRGSNVPYRGST